MRTVDVGSKPESFRDSDEVIEVGGIDLRVVRSKRRTVCIRITDDGCAEVLAPRRADKNSLNEIIKKYLPKIISMREIKKACLEAKARNILGYGDRVRFLGETRIIRESQNGKLAYDEEAFYIPADLGPEGVREAVIGIYKLAAKDYIPGRVNTLAPMVGCSVKTVKINSAYSRWASCSQKEALNFSRNCMMASPKAVDYIIIHELCHIHEFNHSARFWSLVESFCPEYKVFKEELKDLCRQMEYENWK